MSGIKTSETQEERDARECEADMMTALSRLFGEAYMRGRAQGRNDARREEIRRGAGLTSGGGVTPGQTAYEAWRELPRTRSMFAHTKQWHQLPASDADEWEAIAAAVVVKHSREQAQTNAAVVDEGLVDKLARAYIDYRKQDSRWGKMSEADKSDVRYELRIIIGELQKMPCELPTANEYAESMRDSGIVSRHIDDLTRPIEQLVVARVAPILAAKGARIAELEARDFEAGELLAKTHVAHVEATARLGALEKRHAELLAAAHVAFEKWDGDDIEAETAAMVALGNIVDGGA